MESLNLKPKHVGRNVKIFRIIRGINQMDMGLRLQDRLGKNRSQQTISDIEKKEVIDEDLLLVISEILKVDILTLKNMDLEAPIIFMNNTFSNNQFAGHTVNNNPIFCTDGEVMKSYQREKDELRKMYSDLKAKYDALSSESK